MKKTTWNKYFLIANYNRVIRKLKFHKLVICKYKSKNILNGEEAQVQIAQYILEGKPAMIARFGSNEVGTAAEAIGVLIGARKRICENTLMYINRNAGVFPYGQEMAMRFSEILIDAAKQVDLLGEWKSYMQSMMINEVCPVDIKLTHLGNLEPYYGHGKPWTAALKGKKVLVVHPFKDTIEQQYQRREKLFDDPDMLPEFELNVLKAVQTCAYEKDERFSDWCEALEYMYSEAMKYEFDVAIIGCGAYGMPLAAKLKKAGKVAIHLGGATQLLFGIKGARWDNNPIISKLYNEYWVRPSDKETPAKAKQIEGACYW